MFSLATQRPRYNGQNFFQVLLGAQGSPPFGLSKWYMVLCSKMHRWSLLKRWEILCSSLGRAKEAKLSKIWKLQFEWLTLITHLYWACLQSGKLDENTAEETLTLMDQEVLSDHSAWILGLKFIGLTLILKKCCSETWTPIVIQSKFKVFTFRQWLLWLQIIGF